MDGRRFFHVPAEMRGGFQTWIGYENNNAQWDCWAHGHRADGSEVELFRLPGYETDCLTDLLVEYILHRGQARHNGEKEGFFAVLSVQPPHDPYLAPAAFMKRHNPQRLQLRPNVPPIAQVQEQARRELAGAYAQIENLDANLGRIRATLQQAGLDRNTAILFFSDHGDMHGSQGQFRKTAPWEEAVRIPFICGGAPLKPERRAKTRSMALVNHVDIAPTTLGLCGIDKPEWMAGHDYSGEVCPDRAELPIPDSAYLQMVVPTMHGSSIDRPWRGVVTIDGWKYCVLEHQPWLMFNLNVDTYEQMNLAHDMLYREERNRLHQRIAQWIAHTQDDFALPVLNASTNSS
jgi:arylsulfatase A-like enzyme